jgi:hypothetical protein
MYTCKSQKSKNLCNNACFLLFFAKKSKQKRLRLTKNAGAVTDAWRCCFLAPAAPKKTRRTIERGLCPVKSVWLKQFLASSSSTYMLSMAEAQAKPAFF